MKRYFSILVFFVLSLSVFGQTWSFNGRVAYGTYSMNMLKDVQEFRLLQTNLPLKTTDNYPATPFYRVELAINELAFIDKIGVFYTFTSSGARSTLSDYSGKIYLDALINGSQLGLSMQKAFQKSTNYSLGVYGDVSWLKTSLSMEDKIDLTDSPYNEKEKFDFKANGFAFEPGFYAEYILGRIHFQINLGYLVDFNSKLFFEDNKDQCFQVDGKEIKPEWNGLRLGFQSSFFFGKKADDSKK